MGDPSDFLFTGTRGFARIRTLAPGMLHIVLAGHCDDEIYRVLRSKGDEQTWDGTGLVVFYDTTSMTGFEKSFRLKMMAWQAETHGRQFQYVLVKSPIVAAAISAATKFIGGGAQITSNRAKFETLLDDAVASRRISDAASNVQARLPRL
jgi:hypothetical protein